MATQEDHPMQNTLIHALSKETLTRDDLRTPTDKSSWCKMGPSHVQPTKIASFEYIIYHIMYIYVYIYNIYKYTHPSYRCHIDAEKTILKSHFDHLITTTWPPKRCFSVRHKETLQRSSGDRCGWLDQILHPRKQKMYPPKKAYFTREYI